MLNEVKLIQFYFCCELKQCDNCGYNAYHDTLDIDDLIDEHNLLIIKDIVFELLDSTYIDGFELAIETNLDHHDLKKLFYLFKNNYSEINSNIHKKVKLLMPLIADNLQIYYIYDSVFVADDKSIITADLRVVARFSLNECKLLWITKPIGEDGVELISLKDNEIICNCYYAGMWQFHKLSFIDGHVISTFVE